MYCGPTFSYNPQTGDYEHPLYTSVSKKDLINETRRMMGSRYDLDEVMSQILHDFDDYRSVGIDHRESRNMMVFGRSAPIDDIDVIHKHTFARKVEREYPIIEILMLLFELKPDLPQIAFGPDGISL